MPHEETEEEERLTERFYSGPFDYVVFDFGYPRARIRLVKDDWGMDEFELRSPNRSRQPFDLDFTYVVCRAMARPYLHRKSARAKALVRACHRAMRTIKAFGRCQNYQVWHDKLKDEVKAMFAAHGQLWEPVNDFGVTEANARKFRQRDQRRKRRKAKRHT